MKTQPFNTAIISTVANFDLYQKSSIYFPSNVCRYVIDGRNGMYSLDSILYMFKVLKGKGIKWLIMADEDVVFQNSSKVFEVIEYMEKNTYHYCGVRDGGVIPHRIYNPHAINTFFSILHFSEIEKEFNKREVVQNNYIKPKEFSDDLSGLKIPFDETSLFEPYYCFYLWLKRNGFQFLPLQADIPFAGDELTTAVYTPQGDLLLYHTWYARAYGVIEKHTMRIDKVLKLAPETELKNEKPIILKSRNYGWKLKLRKTYKKIKMKFKSK